MKERVQDVEHGNSVSETSVNVGFSAMMDFLSFAYGGSDVRLSRSREKSGGRRVGWMDEHKHTYQTTTSTGNFSMCQ